MNVAIIDIGSNTIRLHIYNIHNKTFESIFTKKIVAGLITYIQDGKLTSRGIKKIIKILLSHTKLIQLFHIDNFFIFATAVLRNISNADEVLSKVKKETGCTITILSQDEEAKLGYKGISIFSNYQSGYSIDIGGGSTEIVQFKNKNANIFLKLNFGCLSLFRSHVHFILPTQDEVVAMTSYINSNLSRNVTMKKLLGIGGTVRAVGNILSECLPNNSPTSFLYSDLRYLFDNLIAQDTTIFNLLIQVSPERIHTIIPGLIILKTIMEYYSVESVEVCSTGLREGVLVSKFL